MNKLKSYALVLILLACFVFFLYGLGEALVPISVSIVLAYIFLPLAQKAEKHGLSRVWSVSLAFVFCSLFNLILLAILIPLLFRELQELFTQIPLMVDQSIQKLEPMLAQFGIHLNINKELIITKATEYVSQISMDRLQSLGEFITRALGSFASLFLAILNILLIPVFFFYLLLDFEKLTASVQNLIPKSMQRKSHQFFSHCDKILSSYIRGQVLVSLILGILYGVAFSLVGIEFGFLIGFITGLLNVIPYAGPLIGLSMALIASIAHYDGLITIFSVLMAFGIVQALESFVITPKIVGDRVGLNSLETMLVLIVGGNILGFMGMLLAIPCGAIIKVVLSDVKKIYLASDFYKEN